MKRCFMFNFEVSFMETETMEGGEYPLLTQMALDCGFTHTGKLKVETLKSRPEVRDACAANRCGSYGQSWSCPPACGSIEDCEKKMRAFKQGLILQTKGGLNNPLDYKSMQKIGVEHSAHMSEFQAAFNAALAAKNTAGSGEKTADNAVLPRTFLLLGAGPCKHCEKCSYPDSPCLFPEKMIISMEAMGLVVSEVCKANDLPYYYGPNTLTYVGCVLF